MRADLEHELCKRFPEMMVNRNLTPQETLMCWGFQCGDGWFPIIKHLMTNIQAHINWKKERREWAISHNEMAKNCKVGDFKLFEEMYSTITDPDFKQNTLNRIIHEPLRDVPEEVIQVTLDQVKEKFGTLRFYYTGGNDYIAGLVTMAESMSGITCEECGNPGRTFNVRGWIRTLCDEHNNAYAK